jgi:hypothetical protein
MQSSLRYLDGLTGSLLVATARAFQLQPCLERTRCLRRRNRVSAQLFLGGIHSYWLTCVSSNKRELIEQRVLHCLHARTLGFSYFEDYVRQFDGSLGPVLSDSFEEWVSILPPVRRQIRNLIAHLLTLNPAISRLEADWCLGLNNPRVISSLAWHDLNCKLFLLLLETCSNLKLYDNPLNGERCLAVNFLPGRPPVVI